MLARAESPTLLLRVEGGGRAGAELLAVSGDGEDARLITLDGQARQVPSVASDLEALLTLAALARHGAAAAGEAGRVAKRAGDGQVMRAGSPGAEPLIVEIQDAAGEPGAGAEVVFTRMPEAAPRLEKQAASITRARRMCKAACR